VKEELTSAGFVAPAKMTLLLQPKPLSGTTLASPLLDAGKRAQAVNQIQLVSLALRRGNFQLAKIQIGFHDVGRLEAGVHGEDVLQAAYEEHRSHQQHQRERHLRDNQTAAEAETLAASARFLPADLSAAAGATLVARKAEPFRKESWSAARSPW